MTETHTTFLWSRLSELAGLFATPLTPSHYVELFNPLWASHTLRARVVAVHEETPDCRTLTLEPGRGFRPHRAGQHVRVSVPVDGMSLTRTYSISSCPERADGCITLTIKSIPDGRVSQHLVGTLQVGDYLTIGLPQGEFLLPEARPVRPLFISGGSGITPIMSMLRSYAARGPLPDVSHLHYAPRPSSLIFAQELDALDAAHPLYDLRRIYTRDTHDGAPAEPYFCATQLEALCPDWRARDVWVCGPQALIDSVHAHFCEAGLAHRVHLERFTAPRAPLPEGAEGGTVTFHQSQRSTRASGTKPLLQVAEDAGLNPLHGCRMGICHSCDTRLVAGCVRDLRSGELLDEPGQTIQPCICAAAGDVTLEL